MLITAGIALFDFACSVFSGVHFMQKLVDLTTLEEADVPHLTVAFMPRTGKETRVHADRFEINLSLCARRGRSSARKCSAPSNSGRAPSFMPCTLRDK